MHIYSFRCIWWGTLMTCYHTVRNFHSNHSTCKITKNTSFLQTPSAVYRSNRTKIVHYSGDADALRGHRKSVDVVGVLSSSAVCQAA